MEMTYAELTELVADTCLLTDAEIASAVRLCDVATVGTFIAVCHFFPHLGIKLHSSDVDTLVNAAVDATS